MNTTLCLIRHGETLWNTEKRIQGHTDIALNETGRQQADAAARWLKLKHPQIQAIYSSDLARAHVTATIVGQALGLTPVPQPAFRERRYGSFEGLTYQEAQQEYATEYAAFEARIPHIPLPGNGESLEMLFQRVTKALETLALAHTNETIAVVAHGGVLDIINRFVRHKPLQDKRDFEVPNAGLNWIQFSPQGKPQWEILDWGNTSHLAATALDELPA